MHESDCMVQYVASIERNLGYCITAVLQFIILHAPCCTCITLLAIAEVLTYTSPSYWSRTRLLLAVPSACCYDPYVRSD
jgi:hypothetical protein